MADYTLTYDDYIFPYNPETLKIKKTRSLKIYNTPSKKVYAQELGYNPTVITGEGYLVGEDCVVNFTDLYNKFIGTPMAGLHIPHLQEMDYYFTALEIIFTGETNSIGYSFEFTSA